MDNRFRFRVWFTPDYQEPEMIYDAEQTYDNRCRCQGSFYHESFGEILEDKGCIVMQCTGLKDKNGKLIYESDIITDGIENYVVVWIDDDDHLGFYVRDLDNVHYTFYQLLEYTIIGNVYQNPELLEDNNG